MIIQTLSLWTTLSAHRPKRGKVSAVEQKHSKSESESKTNWPDCLFNCYTYLNIWLNIINNNKNKRDTQKEEECFC